MNKQVVGLGVRLLVVFGLGCAVADVPGAASQATADDRITTSRAMFGEVAVA